MKMINSKILLISLILILLFSLQAVSALDDNDFNQSNIASPILNDDGITDYSFEDNVLRASSDNHLLDNGYENSETACDLNQKNSNENPIDSTADILSAQDNEGSSDENQNDTKPNITFDHRTSIDFVFEENTTISDELYKVLGIWDLPYYESAINPWLMNDTTWVYCIDGNSRDPDGAMYFPGFYKRITLTDNDKFINKITGENVLPYLTTYIYQNFNNSDKYGRSSAGTVPILIYVLQSFVHSDYRDPESLYNRRPAGSHGTIYTVVKEVLDTVDSGNGANCSGAFYGSDLLTYQFYLYVPFSELNDDIYQTTLGFNIFTKINVTKIWDDDSDCDNLRPEYVDVQLYGNGEAIGDAIQLSEENNWTYTFTDLPVYYLYNDEIVLSESDYSIASIMEDDVDLTLKKVWNESYTGSKPSVISCRLYGNGQYLGLIRLYSSRNWEQTITNLPKYDENGTEMVYTIVDITNYRNSTPTGYIDQNFSDVYQVKHLQYEITNEDLRNKSVYVEVFKNGKYIDVNQISSSNNWTFTVYNLPVDLSENDLILHYAPTGNHVNIVNYTINELNTSDEYIPAKENSSELINPLMPTQDQVTNKYYKYLDLDINKLLKTVTITNKLEVVSINVTKKWEDDGDHDGFRPDKVTIHLTAGNKTIATVNLIGSDWNFTFKNLPKYHDGVLITYNVIEDAVDNYNVSYANNSAYNFTIINSRVIEFVFVNVTKNWNDNFNQDGIRPTNVTIMLLADGANIKNATLNESNSWKFTFSDLDKFKNGKLINYTIKESATDNYNATITNDNNGNWIVNNTHIPAVSDVNVTKVWNDNNDQDGVRPVNVTVVLLADGKIVANATLTANNDWKAVFENLPVYSAGKVIKYSVQELKVANYTVAISNSTAYNWTVNNTHVPEVTDVNVVKVWNDNNNQDGVRPADVVVVLFADGVKVNETVLNDGNGWKYSFKDLPVYNDSKVIKYTIGEVEVSNYTIAVSNSTAYDWTVNNTHVPALTNVSAVKVWNDNNDQDGLRPLNVIVVLNADGVKVDMAVLNSSNGWKYSFTGLPVYNNGQIIKYSVTEFDVSGYTAEITNDTAYNFTVNNTHVPALTNVSVVKVWNDNNNQDGLRQVNVTVMLYANGVNVRNVTLNESNKWKYTFEKLDKFENGNLIKYTIAESAIAGYEAAIVSDDNANWTVTNTHVPAVTDINVTKVWNDNNDQDGVRPVNVVVVLYADGVRVNMAVLNSSNGGKHSFKDLPVYKDGQVIKYTVVELDVADYTSEITNDTAYNFTVNNTHIPAVCDVNVTKIWEDNDNQDGVRPPNITVILKADGNIIANATLNSSNNWNTIFRYLPVYKNGNIIKYSIQELTVKNYTSKISNNTQYNWTITNTHIPEVTDVNVTKIWEDNNNQDGARPKNLTVILKADGKMIADATLNSSNWTLSFKNLPVYNNGKKIKYSIEELTVDNYTSVISNDTPYNWTINNNHVPKVTEINITKIWDDNNNQDGIRPTFITVVLLADGVKINETTLNTSNNWTISFKNLPVYKNGSIIKYLIQELTVDNYTGVISNDTPYNWIINNTYIPKVTEINVTKIWNDNNNQDKIRPTEVKVVLFADGIEVDDAILSAGNDWKYTFSNLPVYNSGKSINYTIGEVEVSNYTVDIVGENGNFTITNTHIHVYSPNMSVEKISLKKTVKVGQQARFQIVVKNTGDCELTGVYVIDDDYTQGIVIDHMIPNSDWTFDGKGKFTYRKTLGVGESSSFTVVFNTTSAGLKVNNVTAGNNITNLTVHSTNTTNVTNETEPVPPQPIPPSPEEPKLPNKEIIPDKHATGNPIFVLVLVLFTLSVNISIRKK
nr:Cna B-type domain-containing protein [uncultured Methanobrevibacter sp.]